MSADSPTHVRVRRPDEQDLPVLTELFAGYLRFYEASADDSRIREFLDARIAQGQAIVLLAETVPMAVVGFTLIYPTFSSVSMAPVWTLNDLFVRHEARRLGVARALIRACVEEGRRAGVVRIQLETARHNRIARSLYESEGFEVENVFVRYRRETQD